MQIRLRLLHGRTEFLRIRVGVHIQTIHRLVQLFDDLHARRIVALHERRRLHRHHDALIQLVDVRPDDLKLRAHRHAAVEILQIVIRLHGDLESFAARSVPAQQVAAVVIVEAADTLAVHEQLDLRLSPRPLVCRIGIDQIPDILPAQTLGNLDHLPEPDELVWLAPHASACRKCLPLRMTFHLRICHIALRILEVPARKRFLYNVVPQQDLRKALDANRQHIPFSILVHEIPVEMEHTVILLDYLNFLRYTK